MSNSDWIILCPSFEEHKRIGFTFYVFDDGNRKSFRNVVRSMHLLQAESNIFKKDFKSKSEFVTEKAMWRLTSKI